MLGSASTRYDVRQAAARTAAKAAALRRDRKAGPRLTPRPRWSRIGAEHKLRGRQGDILHTVTEHRLSPSQHLAWIRENVDVVLAIAPDQLEASVIDCPGWQVHSIANHLARNSLMYEAGIRLPPGGGVADAVALAFGAENLSGQAALERCRTRYDDLLAIFGGAEPSTPCAFYTGDADVAAWLWHVAVETWVHRADVEHTLGITPDLGPQAGFDALDWSRLWRVRFSEQDAYEPPPAIRCQATDSDATVVVGSGPPAASVLGKGCDLALRLWNRQHGPLQGDGGAVQAWADLVYRSA